MVDLDSQANATASLGVTIGEQSSVHDVVVKGLSAEQAIVSTRISCLDLLPAAPNLVAADVELASRMSREYKLKRALDELGETYQYIFIDCPPGLTLLVLNAFAAASKVLVPVQCEYLALEGLSELLTTIDLAKMHLNTELEVAGIVMTMYDQRVSLHKYIVNEVRSRGPFTFDTIIPRKIRAAEAPLHGMSVMEFAPDSVASQAYKALADELMAVLDG